ncbi:MarR family transcriptional regulator [Aquimarina sp. D1M17]|uniref:MarR family winged helix-turn-helix transcriptional regulator n=1 Tax=Aquimarina acroporae TaxID=2937283 RepID=UPI0020BEA183|nr:MarR family transcriptional regulator [Aquimarina acroporae]MCK8521805.1 MarR family transcriptional regulator [Aquimarina acroporae]
MKESPRHKSIGAQMAIAQQLLKRNHHKAFKEAGMKITLEQMVVLEMLHIQGDMNMTELSKGVWKQNANITRIVDKLENLKFLVRKPVEGDRRANLLSITPEGSAYFKELVPIVQKTYKQSVSCLTKEEESYVLEILKKLIDHLS